MKKSIPSRDCPICRGYGYTEPDRLCPRCFTRRERLNWIVKQFIANSILSILELLRLH